MIVHVLEVTLFTINQPQTHSDVDIVRMWPKLIAPGSSVVFPTQPNLSLRLTNLR